MHCNALHHTQEQAYNDMCIESKCTATHCNTLQHTATHCNTLPCTTAPYIYIRLKSKRTMIRASHWEQIYSNTLQRTATHCNTLQHTQEQIVNDMCITLRKKLLHHTTTHCNTLQHTATHCIKIQSKCTRICAWGLRMHRSKETYEYMHTWIFMESCAKETNSNTSLKRDVWIHANIIIHGNLCKKTHLETLLKRDVWMHANLNSHENLCKRDWFEYIAHKRRMNTCKPAYSWKLVQTRLIWIYCPKETYEYMHTCIHVEKRPMNTWIHFCTCTHTNIHTRCTNQRLAYNVIWHIMCVCLRAGGQG